MLALDAASTGRRGPGQAGSARVFPGVSESRAAGFGVGMAWDVMPGCPQLAVAADAAVCDGDGLSFTRLQDMLELKPGNLIIQLRKLEEAGYLSSEKTRNGSAQKTTVTLTRQGRAALGTYTQALRDLLGGL